MEGEVPRRRGGGHRHKGRIGRPQRARGRVEAVHHQPVRAEFRLDGEAVVGRGVEGMGVRPGLPRIGPGAGVLDEGRGLAQGTVGIQRQDGHAAAPEIGQQEVAPRMVRADVAGARASRGDLVEEGQAPGRGIDRVGADRAGGAAPELVDLIGGIQRPARGREGHVGRIAGLRRQPERGELPGVAVEPEGVDPAARPARRSAMVRQLLPVGVRAHIDIGRRRGGVGTGDQREEDGRDEGAAQHGQKLGSRAPPRRERRDRAAAGKGF